MSGPERRSGPAVGLLNAVMICAGGYGLFACIALAGGRSAILMCLLLLMGLLHACLKGFRTAVAFTSSPAALERSTVAFSATSRDR